MFTPAPSEHELAAAGLTEEDFYGEEVEVWPENYRAFELFCTLRTQWRVGMAGRTGLDYVAIPVTLRLLGVPRPEWPSLFEDMRTMELAALEAMLERD